MDLLHEGSVSTEQVDVTDEQVNSYPSGQFDYFQEIIGDEGTVARFSQRSLDQLLRGRAFLENDDRRAPCSWHGENLTTPGREG